MNSGDNSLKVAWSSLKNQQESNIWAIWSVALQIILKMCNFVPARCENNKNFELQGNRIWFMLTKISLTAQWSYAQNR